MDAARRGDRARPLRGLAYPGARGPASPRSRPSYAQQSADPPLELAEAQRRALNLEKNLQFLEQQHSEMLHKLHEEIEHLKRENKDLQYKLIMNEKPQKKGSLSTVSVQTNKSLSNSSASDCRKLSGFKGKGAARREPRKAAPDPYALKPSGGEPWSGGLEERQHKQDRAQLSIWNNHLMWQTHPANSQGKTRPQRSSKRQEKKSDAPQKTDLEEQPLSAALFNSSKLDRVPGAQGQAKDENVEASISGATLIGGSQYPGQQGIRAAPLVNLPPHLRKPGTVQQCELQHLKSLLEGNQRPKAATDEAGPGSPKDQEAMQFPKLPNKVLSKKRLILSPIPVAERAILPALRQSLKNNFSERQKRLQVMQSRRLHRSVLNQRPAARPPSPDGGSHQPHFSATLNSKTDRTHDRSNT